MNKGGMEMALVNCPECSNQVSSSAAACPKCGYPLLKTEYATVEVWFNGSNMQGENSLKEMLRNGWQIVNQDEVVEYDSQGSIQITKYKLQRHRLTTHPMPR